eukprot:2265078-Pleurochrysis_carterae.AAC.1
MGLKAPRSAFFRASSLCARPSLRFSQVHDLLAREAELNARTNGRRQLSKKHMRPIAASDFE